MKRIFAIFVVAALACTLVFATACVTDANVTTEQLLEAMSAPGDIQSISITVSNGELNTADYRLIYSYYADGNGEPVIDGILKDDPDLPYKDDDDLPYFALVEDAQDGYVFSVDDFADDYDNRLDSETGIYSVTGTLADPADFLGVDAASATVQALISGDLMMDALTITFVGAESGNDITINIMFL